MKIVYNITFIKNKQKEMFLKSFFNPKSVAVIGVSRSANKLSSIIFDNLIKAKYRGKLYGVNPKLHRKKLKNKQCFASMKDIPHSVDLAIIVIPAKFVSSVIDDCIKNKTKNVSIITAGFSEVGNKSLETEIYTKCSKAGINVLGPNCLGHISTFTNLNASFADGFPQRGSVAFISQSGAFCSALMDWAGRKNIGFSHFISIGNKIHLSEVELLKALKNDPNTESFMFYLESLKDGREFIKLIKEVSKTKPVVILEPGKSKKAQAASKSHTGSLAPNYRVLETAFEKAGAIQVYSTRELFGLLEILQYSKHKNFDEDFVVVTNAGGEGVLVSDLCEEANLTLKKPSQKTVKKLKACLPAEAGLENPIDVIGDARADRYENALRVLCQSNEYKNILVLLTPQRITDERGTAEAIVKISKKFPKINIFTSFIGGARVKKGIRILRKNNIIHFYYPVDGIRPLGLLKKQIQNRDLKEAKIKSKKVPENIKKAVSKSIGEKLESLPQNIVDKIIRHYGIDHVKSGFFTNRAKAVKFATKFFPNSVVMKLSSPDAIHKTEMKGVYLNIGDKKKFEEVWESLQKSIKKFKLKNAGIVVQEQISDALEIIAGVNTDKNFGKMMVFGTGGIYTGFLKDTSLRVLPTNDFKKMIAETKIGTILKGVRGKKRRALEPLISTLRKIQQLVFDIPEIKSIDANPILVTDKRALVVDLKVIF